MFDERDVRVDVSSPVDVDPEQTKTGTDLGGEMDARPRTPHEMRIPQWCDAGKEMNRQGDKEAVDEAFDTITRIYNDKLKSLDEDYND